MMAKKRPTAFVHVDMDGLWAIRTCYARPVGDSYRSDPVWQEGAHGFLALFARLGIASTFFLVGRDLELDWKRDIARKMHAAGHEIANHSYTHRIGLTAMPVGAITEEVRRGHDAIVRAGLPVPVGFRAPGYDVDARVLRVVRRLGYAYDSSMLPTRLGPLLRLADAWLARRWQPDKRQFGRFAYGAAPRVPYVPDPWRVRKRARKPTPGDLLEFPVSTIPPWGFPMTGSAIFAFGPDRVIEAMRDARREGRTVLLLLHGIDLTDCDRPVVFRQRMPSAGGFDISARRKQRMIEPVLKYLAKEFDIQRTCDWLRENSRPDAAS